MSRSVCQEETQKNLAAIGKAIAAIEKGLSGAQRTQCQRTLWTRDTKFHGISWTDCMHRMHWVVLEPTWKILNAIHMASIWSYPCCELDPSSAVHQPLGQFDKPRRLLTSSTVSCIRAWSCAWSSCCQNYWYFENFEKETKETTHFPQTVDCRKLLADRRGWGAATGGFNCQPQARALGILSTFLHDRTEYQPWNVGICRDMSGPNPKLGLLLVCSRLSLPLVRQNTEHGSVPEMKSFAVEDRCFLRDFRFLVLYMESMEQR